MLNKNEARLRRARKTRAKIAELKAVRLCINRTNQHIYAQIISACGGKVLAAASSLEATVRKDLPNGGNVAAAAVIGKLIAERAKLAGVETVSFDRSGFQYHGRVAALANAAREAGLKF
jgi:large subunit ribosomal protein L18